MKDKGREKKEEGREKKRDSPRLNYREEVQKLKQKEEKGIGKGWWIEVDESRLAVNELSLAVE